MAAPFDLRTIQELSRAPAENVGQWLSQAEDGVSFLKQNTLSEDVIIYASLQAFYSQVVLVPLTMLDPPDFADLRADYVNIADCWSISESWGMGAHSLTIEPPLAKSSSKTLAAGEKLVFWRDSGGLEIARRVEISQKLVHCLGVHFLDEHNAFCKLDEQGDIREVIRLLEVQDGDRQGIIVTVKREEFAEYMTIAGIGMVTLFDLTRCPSAGFYGFHGDQRENRTTEDMDYDVGIMDGHASFAYGRLVTRPAKTVERIKAERENARNPEAQQYATFKILDWKNGQEIETSCSPDSLASYFEPDSPLPLQISPAFFRPEVLQRFKADHHKYTLTSRTISCRGTWSLTTYDINDAGQVHTYIRYLSYLPYDEQLYWKAFNEWPKGSISARAMETDIHGNFSSQYDPLGSLMDNMRKLDRASPAWWRARDETLYKALHAPVTASPGEWASEIGALDQLVIEGFLKGELAAEAKRQGQAIETQWGSLKLIEACLVGVGQTTDTAKSITAPFHELHGLRNLLHSHAAVEKAAQIEKTTIKLHGSFRNHFLDLVARCDTSLNRLIRSLGIALAGE